MKTYRFGIKVRLPLRAFPNAGIFVVKLTAAQGHRLDSAIATVQDILDMAGYTEVANAIIFEERK